jgi:undecaprenyl-phosphate 4-deoxy-4-formamido-L-arabinose transferase
VKLIRLNFDLITGFSLAPLQWFTLLALACAGLSFAFVVVVGGRWLVSGSEDGALFTLFGILFLLVSLVMVGIGLIGEYVGRACEAVRRRDRFRVREILERRG